MKELLLVSPYLPRSIIADVKKGEPSKNGTTSKIESIVAKLKTSAAVQNKFVLPSHALCPKYV